MTPHFRDFERRHVLRVNLCMKIREFIRIDVEIVVVNISHTVTQKGKPLILLVSYFTYSSHNTLEA